MAIGIMKTIFSLCLAAHASAGVITLPDSSTTLPEGEIVVWLPLFQARRDAMNDEIGMKNRGYVRVLRCRFNENSWGEIAAMGEGSLLIAVGNTLVGNFQNRIEVWNGASVILSGNMGWKIVTDVDLAPEE